MDSPGAAAGPAKAERAAVSTSLRASYGVPFAFEDHAMTVTKKELSDHLADHLGLTRRESQGLVETFFATIRNTLATGEEVKLSGFGKFTLREKKPRPGRNPRTLAPTEIAARRVVSFRASNRLRQPGNPGGEPPGP